MLKISVCVRVEAGSVGIWIIMLSITVVACGSVSIKLKYIRLVSVDAGRSLIKVSVL